MTQIKVGDLVVLAKDFDTTEYYGDALNKMRTEPVTVTGATTDGTLFQVYIPFPESPWKYLTFVRTEIELYTEPVDTSKLMELL